MHEVSAIVTLVQSSSMLIHQTTSKRRDNCEISINKHENTLCAVECARSVWWMVDSGMYLICKNIMLVGCEEG